MKNEFETKRIKRIKIDEIESLFEEIDKHDFAKDAQVQTWTRGYVAPKAWNVVFSNFPRGLRSTKKQIQRISQQRRPLR